MNRLYCLRHAKAVGKNAADDVDRALAPRGRRQMDVMARFLKEERIKPDRALVSPSARTRETWKRAGIAGVPTTFDPRIYDASADTLLTILREADPAAQSLILVGHNPGFEDLARSLAGGASDAGALVRLRSKAPTASLAIFDLPISTWADASPGAGRLIGFVTPAWLGDEPDD